MMDFCYFANALCCIAILMGIPYIQEMQKDDWYSWGEDSQKFKQVVNVEKVFFVVFAISNGILSWSVVLFKNAFVLHDIHRLTSLFIHFGPYMVFFNFRWHSKILRFKLDEFNFND